MSPDYASSDKKDRPKKRRGRRNAEIPESPSLLEQSQPLSQREGRRFSLSLSRQLYSQNGVPFLYSSEGETYADIAKANGLFKKEILRFNDLKEDTTLLPGTTVYLQRKKAQAAEQVEKHVVEADETLRDISQRYGVRLKSLLKINGFTEDHVVREGDMVKLRRR